MQLVINTYLHIKDELFEVRVKKDDVVEKHHFASQKVKSIQLSKGAAIITDAVTLVMKPKSISLCLNMMPAPGMPSVSGQQDNAVT